MNTLVDFAAILITTALVLARLVDGTVLAAVIVGLASVRAGQRGNQDPPDPPGPAPGGASGGHARRVTLGLSGTAAPRSAVLTIARGLASYARDVQSWIRAHRPRALAGAAR